MGKKRDKKKDTKPGRSVDAPDDHDLWVLEKQLRKMLAQKLEMDLQILRVETMIATRRSGCPWPLQ